MDNNFNFPIPKLPGYKNLVVIGEGAFARVYKATHILTKTEVAIKQIPIEGPYSKTTEEELNMEIETLSSVKNPYIVKYFDAFKQDIFMFIVMEYIPNGTLTDRLENEDGISLELCRTYFAMIVSSVATLHDVYKMCHRDLKPDNILIDKYGILRLIDFGFATFVDPEDPLMHFPCGSTAFASPEMVNGMPYTIATDAWSLGVILYLMATDSLPFDSDNLDDLKAKITSEPLEFPSKMNDDLKDLIKRLLDRNPATRLSVFDAINHPFLAPAIGYVYINFADLKGDIMDNLYKEAKINRKKLSDKEAKVVDNILLRTHQVNQLLEALSIDADALNLIKPLKK